MSNLEPFIEKLMKILDNGIVEVLRRNRHIEIVVIGGKAINILLAREYHVETIDWDIGLKGPIEKTTRIRDTLGKALANYLNRYAQNQKLRIEALEEYYDVKLLNIKYELNLHEFTAFTGQRYMVGHVNVNTSMGRYSIIDVTPYLTKDDYYEIDNVKYLSIPDLVANLNALIKLPGYKKKEKILIKLNKIRNAVQTRRLTCNYYKLAEERSPRCDRNVIVGPSMGERRKFPRFQVSARDVESHDMYIRSLPSSLRQLIFGYTTGKSFNLNGAMIRRELGHNVPIPSDVETLQRVILESPPLQKDMVVYCVNRYAFHPSQKRGNFDLKKGDIERRIGFTSTTYDNQYNPRPFLDLFSEGIAYVIKIPAGMRALIVDKNSAYPGEHEVILPYSTKLKIDKVALRQITYREIDTRELWYDEMLTYLTHVSSEPHTHDHLPLHTKGIHQKELWKQLALK